MRRAAAAIVAAGALAGAAPAAGQGEIVRLTIAVAPVVAAGAPVPLAVTVDADQGALTARQGHLRLRVRYAPECAGTFAGTPGPVAIDAQIPDPGTANTTYHATLKGSAAVPALGAYSVCAYLEEDGSGRLFAQDSDTQFNATPACTAATRNAAAARSALKAARRKLAHVHGAARKRTLRAKLRRLRARQGAAVRAERTACS